MSGYDAWRTAGDESAAGVCFRCGAETDELVDGLCVDCENELVVPDEVYEDEFEEGSIE